ncbi:MULTISPECIES: TonB-dependent hemoglobin/transferrin/lactoferrin family receptor [Rhodomicrobium]|uniref:TonB-dependent hemoglobin/transferrin/lactoferrin family receptor n=1 Tax=Rhodomicrobium TaxID=1068 RepID=UPI000B4A5FE9|nr:MULTISPECIES: TonB-dependent hemoglobin/transferrin/lactoferrin family receptor [Rhodomicrobium]
MRTNLLRWGAYACLIACALPIGASRAQDNGEEQAAAASGGIALDPITVFATLSPISAFDYPGQVSVVEREEIETKQANSLTDVIKDLPGVFVDGGARRSGQAPTIRGARDEDILILIDGVKQSFISGHDGRIFIEPDLLKTVEVVKGPMSALYGSGALGGVIALTTVDAADFLAPGETAGVRIKAGYQSVNDEFTITSTGFARSHDGKFDIVSSFTYRDGGDIELGNDTTLPEQEQIQSSLLKGSAELAPDLKLTGTWVHYQNDALNPNNPQPDTPPTAPGVANPNALVNRFTQSDTVSGKLSYAPTGNPFIDANLLVYWAQHTNKEDDTTGPRLTTREIETTGVNLDNRSRFDLADWAKLTLTYGAEYYVDRQTGTDNSPILSNGGPQPKNVPNADATYYGVFTQAEFKIDQPMSLPGELSIIPGVRFDGFENAYKDTQGYEDFEDNAISKKLGVAYKPVPWLLLFGNYGEAFRAPSYTELYAQGTHFRFSTSPFGPLANIFKENPFLKPQEGVTTEGGVGFDFKDVVQSDDRLTIKGSYWSTDAKNFIDLDVDTSGCFPGPGQNQDRCSSQFNNKDAELDGFEIGAKYDTARWYAGASFSHIDGTDKTNGNYLGVLQPDKFVVDGGVKVPEWYSRFGMRVTFADEFTKFNPPTSALDAPEGPRAAYNLVDLYAVIEPEDGPFKGFRLDLGIDNITDEAYELIAADVYEEGINFKAALAWTHKW